MNKDPENEANEVYRKALLARHSNLKARLEDYRPKIKWMIISAIFGAVIGALIGFSSSSGYDNRIDIQKIIKYCFISTISVFGLYLYFTVALTFFVRPRLREVEYELSKFGNEKLQENIGEDFFNKLIQINFKYIDQYYLQTQEQANKSFLLSAAAAIVGLLILATGIIMMFIGIVEPAYVTTASGLLSEFLAAVFFYLYNKTILKMGNYHQKLVLTQNVSLALKISEELTGEDGAKAKLQIIDRLTENVNELLTSGKRDG